MTCSASIMARAPGWSWGEDAPVYVYYDFETTGPNPAVDEAVQFGAVCRGEGFARLVRPLRRRVSPGAAAVHGLTDAKLRGAASFAVVWAEFLVFLAPLATGARHVVFVGHNSWTFDDPLLAAELQRHELPRPEAALASWAPAPRVWSADTLRAARRACPTGAALRLTALRERFLGAGVVGAHDALADARAVADVAPFLEQALEYRPLEEAYAKLRERRQKADARTSGTMPLSAPALGRVVGPGTSAPAAPSPPKGAAAALPSRKRNRRCEGCSRVVGAFWAHLCAATEL